MKTKLFIICSFWLLLLSCDRKILDQNVDPGAGSDVLIREAQTYFQTLTSQRARISAYESFLPKEWLDNRMPQWAQAITFTSDGKNVVEVPLLYNNVDPVYTFDSEALGAQAVITRRNGVTKALFFKHEDGSIAIYIMKLILDPAYLDKVKANNQYKNLSFNTVNQDFSGVMLLSGWNEKLLDMYVFKDGKIKARTRPHTDSTAPGARKRQCYYNPKCDRVCIGISSNCCTPEDEAYNPTGWCCNESYRYCNYQCVYDEICYPDDNPQEPSTGSPGDNTPYDPGDASMVELNGYTAFGAGPGRKPMYETEDRCDFAREAWDRSVASNKEYFGVVTKNGEYLITQEQGSTGGAINGIFNGSDGHVYYYYPRSEGPNQFSGSQAAKIGGKEVWAIEIRSTVHTHTPCLDDGTDGVSHTVGEDDRALASTLSSLHHFVIGCNGTTAEFNSSSTKFYNKGGGCATLFFLPSEETVR